MDQGDGIMGDDPAFPQRQVRIQSPDTQEDVDAREVISHGAKQIISLFIPVSICMFAVVLAAKTIPYFASTDVYLLYTPFHTPDADVGTQVWQTVANVAIFLGVIVVMTFVLVCLFKFQCYKCLNVWLTATTFILVFIISFIFFTEVLRASNIFFDNITFSILLWNFGVLGLLAIHWRSPLIIQQAYLIFNSVQLALIFLKFLPKWTCWVLLGALAIWDLVAVLCPKGPLRMLVDMAHERQQPLFPAMIYSTTATYLTSNKSDISEPLMMRNESCRNRNKATCLAQGETVSDEADTRKIELKLLTPVEFSGDANKCSNGPDSPHQEKRNLKSNPVEPKKSKKKTTKHLINTDGSGESSYSPSTTVGNVNNIDNPLHEGSEVQNMGPTANERWRDLQADVMQRNKDGVKLGLGDFIFYSLLIGRAALDGDTMTVVACYVAVLVGMCLTIVALGIARKALPALPISIACGIIFYFSTAAVISPFIQATSIQRIYF